MREHIIHRLVGIATLLFFIVVCLSWLFLHSDISFHGKTLGALSVTDTENFSEEYYIVKNIQVLKGLLRKLFL